MTDTVVPPNSRQSFDLGVKTLRKCLDDAAAKPGFRLRKNAILFAKPVVSDRKLPPTSKATVATIMPNFFMTVFSYEETD